MGSMHTGLEDRFLTTQNWQLILKSAKGGVGLIVTGGISPNCQDGWLRLAEP